MTTLLIDADILVYKIASACEVPTDWGDGLWTLHSDENEAYQQLDTYLTDLTGNICGNEKDVRIIMALTDLENFRKNVLPSYKGNRQNNRKPICLQALRKYVAESYETFQRPGLEGDDILGILATQPEGPQSVVKGPRIVVSIDKDLRSIPGKLYDPKNPDQGVIEISENEADYWHMYQTLCGDATDGYSGCPGVGPKTADKILSASPEWWPSVIKAYAKAGLGAEEALTQARVARILRASDYDFINKKPILWTPVKAEAAA